MTTTDIDKWLSDIALDSSNEIEDLYTCVESEMDMNLFHISINENQPRRLFIKPVACEVDTLMLTDSSRPVFISKMKQKYCKGLDVDAYCALERDKEK